MCHALRVHCQQHYLFGTQLAVCSPEASCLYAFHDAKGLLHDDTPYYRTQTQTHQVPEHKACVLLPSATVKGLKTSAAAAPDLSLQGVDDQGHTDKELGRELGEILSEAADVGVHLLHASRVDEVAAGALIDVPRGQQAEGALARQGLQEVAQVVELIQQVAVGQHHPLQHLHLVSSMCMQECGEQGWEFGYRSGSGWGLGMGFRVQGRVRGQLGLGVGIGVLVGVGVGVGMGVRGWG